MLHDLQESDDPFDHIRILALVVALVVAPVADLADAGEAAADAGGGHG